MSKHKIFSSLFLSLVFATMPVFRGFSSARNIKTAKRSHGVTKKVPERVINAKKRIVRKKKKKDFFDQVYRKFSEVYNKIYKKISKIDIDIDQIQSLAQCAALGISGFKVFANFKNSFSEEPGLMSKFFSSIYKSGTWRHLDALFLVASFLGSNIFADFFGDDVDGDDTDECDTADKKDLPPQKKQQ